MMLSVARLLALGCVVLVGKSEAGFIVNPNPDDEVAWFRKLALQQRDVCFTHRSCLQNQNTEDSGSYCCGHCTCDSSCKKYGICCLEVFDNFTDAKITTDKSRYGCVELQYLTKRETEYLTDHKNWMITRCDRQYTNTDYKNLCEHPGTDDILDTVIPVADTLSDRHFRNIFCAYCNGIEEGTRLLTWKFKVASDIFIPLPDKNILAKITESKGNIFYEQPGHTNTVACDSRSFTVSSCNETGLWSEYDKYIAEACNSFVDPFNATYKNYFCYLCNIKESVPTANWTCVKDSGYIKDVTPRFFALLDIATVKGEDKSELLDCHGNQFADYKLRVCRDVFCHRDRFLLNGRCDPQIINSTVFHPTCLGVFIKITPSREISLAVFKKINIEHVLADKVGNQDIITTAYFFYNMSPLLKQVDFMVVYLTVYSTTAWAIKTFIDAIMSFDNQTLIAYHRDVAEPFSVQLALYNIVFSDNQSPKIYVNDATNLSTPITLYSTQDDWAKDSCLYQNTSLLNKFYTCPFIKINMTEMSSGIENGILSLRKGDASRVFSEWEYEMEEDKILICLDDYKELYSRIKTIESDVTNYNSDVYAKQVLSLVCVCLSIVCLLVTIVIYISFTPLQSQPGMNNTILCIFLILAQALYQFGAGQQSLSALSCSVIGAVCHFLWLAVIFSMNVCSINMFIVFRRPTKLSPTFSWNHTIKTLLYIVCPSLGFVFINLVVSLGISHGTDSGYGGDVCYISTNIMQSITFILPSAVTLVINILLFSYVVYSIGLSKSLTTKFNRDRNYLGIYARLSTLTGITWIFGFLRIFLSVEVLEYLFIIFNASQGIFIMIAFVLNRRVYALCCARDAFVYSKKTNETIISKRESSRWSSR